MNKKCLVSFSNSTGARENYNKSQLRLIRSFVETNWDGEYLLRSTDSYVDEHLGVKIKLGSLPFNNKYGLSPSHFEMPYAFKCYLIAEAIEAGFTHVIWCDSTIIKVRENIEPLWEHAKEHGVTAFNNLGHPLKYYITDIALQRLGISEQQLENIEQIMACCILFDFTNPKGVAVFEEWMTRCRDGVSFNMRDYGSVRPGFKVHPGDQPVLSGILWKHGINLLPYGNLIYEPHDETKEFGDDYYFINKGIV